MKDDFVKLCVVSLWNAGYLQGQDSNSIWRGQIWKYIRPLPEIQNLQPQLAARKLRNFFPLLWLSSFQWGFQCWSVSELCLIKSQKQDNSSYVCCGLLCVCYSHYKFSVIYLSNFPRFGVLHSGFTDTPSP